MRLSLIALKVTRYSDTQSILTAFSRERGLVSLAIPAGKGREASRVRALTMPLGIVECDTDIRPGREILPMRQTRPLRMHPSLSSNPMKQMVAMFAAEVVAAAMRGGDVDGRAFDFICGAAGELDAADSRATANFPVCFLYRLAEMLGVEPDVSTFHPGRMLDMRDGTWRSSAPLHGESLTPSQSAAAAMLSRMTFANMGAFRFSRADRAAITDAILRYYSIHICPTGSLRSLDILRAML